MNKNRLHILGAELQDKAADIEEKAAALSQKDRRAFQAELERLGVGTRVAALKGHLPQAATTYCDSGRGGAGYLYQKTVKSPSPTTLATPKAKG